LYFEQRSDEPARRRPVNARRSRRSNRSVF